MVELSQDLFDITEIDDVQFKEALFEAVTKQDDNRRFTNHSTDIIYCLIKAFGRKVVGDKQEYSEEQYSIILSWMFGKGLQIGITNALNLGGEIVILYNPEDPNSSGSIDFNFKDMDYELKTSLSSHKTRKTPWMSAIIQAVQYQAARGRKEIKIKLWYVERWFQKEPSPKWCHAIKERTWLIKLTEEAISIIRSSMKSRDTKLTHSLLTGDWHSLPPSANEWECNGCLICGMLQTLEEEGLLSGYHAEFLKLRQEYINKMEEEKKSGKQLPKGQSS